MTEYNRNEDDVVDADKAAALAARYEALERKYENLPLTDVVRFQAEMRAKKEEKEEELSSINFEYDYLRKKLVPKMFEEQGITVLKVVGVGRVNLQADLLVGIVPGKKAEAYQWLRDTGREALIQDFVNPSTLKAACKSAFKDGEVWPEELFRQIPETMAKITKA